MPESAWFLGHLDPPDAYLSPLAGQWGSRYFLGAQCGPGSALNSLYRRPRESFGPFASGRPSQSYFLNEAQRASIFSKPLRASRWLELGFEPWRLVPKPRVPCLLIWKLGWIIHSCIPGEDWVGVLPAPGLFRDSTNSCNDSQDCVTM